MNLESLVGTLEESEQEVADIDLSDLFGQPVSTIVWKFRDPSLPELFSVPKIAKRVKTQFPVWPDELTGLVALMSMSYVRAGGDKQPSYLLFAHMASRMNTKFLAVSARWKAQFPHLDDMRPLADAEKNDDGTDDGDHAPVPDVPAPSA